VKAVAAVFVGKTKVHSVGEVAVEECCKVKEWWFFMHVHCWKMLKFLLRTIS
jgi:hypothetical protein